MKRQRKRVRCSLYFAHVLDLRELTDSNAIFRVQVTLVRGSGDI